MLATAQIWKLQQPESYFAAQMHSAVSNPVAAQHRAGDSGQGNEPLAPGNDTPIISSHIKRWQTW